MPLDKKNPANEEILRRRQLKPGVGQVIFRAGEKLRDPGSRKIFQLPAQRTVGATDFAEERIARKERWAKVSPRKDGLTA